MAQLVITAAFTAVGFQFGAPQLGYSIGAHVGGRHPARRREAERLAVSAPGAQPVAAPANPEPGNALQHASSGRA